MVFEVLFSAFFSKKEGTVLHLYKYFPLIVCEKDISVLFFQRIITIFVFSTILLFMAIKLTTYYKGEDIPQLPGTNAFHSTALFRIYESTPGFKPILIVAREEEQVLGKILAVIRLKRRLFPPSFLKRCVVYDTGEYFSEKYPEQTVFNELLDQLTREALRYSYLIEFRNLSQPLFGYKAFRKHNYYAVNWLRVVNNLEETKDIEDAISASRMKEVRKGQNNGAKVKVAQNMEEIEAFVKMLLRNYSSKVRKYIPSVEFFKQLDEMVDIKKNKNIFIVEHKKKIIGGSVCIYSDDTAYIWFSGGLKKRYFKQYPGVLAVWYALKAAKESGYKYLEFMDVGLPFHKHGYRDFVLRFGGKPISTRRWYLLKWKWLNRVLNLFYH